MMDEKLEDASVRLAVIITYSGNKHVVLEVMLSGRQNLTRQNLYNLQWRTCIIVSVVCSEFF